MAVRLDVRYVHYYTDGSAARKVAPIEPYQTLKLPRMKKKKKLCLWIDPVASAGIVLAAVMMVLLIVGTVQLQNTRQEAAAMSSYAQMLRRENGELRHTYETSYDLDTVKENAKALGLVSQDQVKHITLQVPMQEKLESPGIWERFYSFLIGLFA